MKIVIPTIDYPPIEGGIGTVALEVARALSSLGHDVVVVAPWFPKMEAFDAQEPYTVVRFKGYDWGWLRLAPLWRATKPHLTDADRIIAINIAYGGVIGRYSNVPYTALAYGYEFLKYARWPWAAGFIRSLFTKADHVLAISEFTATSLTEFGVPRESISIRLPGVSTVDIPNEAFLADVRRRFLLEGHRLIFSLGRMIPRKNHVALVRAMPKILEAVPEAVLVIAGRGPEMHTISRAAVDLGVREHVLLPGRISDEDRAALYALCDVFALANTETTGGSVEGFGLVFTEAAAYGKPTVAGNSGGAAEAVLNEVTGIHVNPDDTDAIAKAIIDLLTNPARAQAMGNAGQRRATEDLSWTTFAKATLSHGN